jgi:hypothetical protein
MDFGGRIELERGAAQSPATIFEHKALPRAPANADAVKPYLIDMNPSVMASGV